MILHPKEEDKIIAGIGVYMPAPIRYAIERIPVCDSHHIEEIRLGVNRPLIVGIRGECRFVTPQGELSGKTNGSIIVTRESVRRCLEVMCENSVYAAQEQIKNGYITLSGGHRVGVVGSVVVENGLVVRLKDIAALNIRIAREIKGAANSIIDSVADNTGLHNTLIVSPPLCGKTTLLRDLARQLGSDKMFKVGIADERSEIAACYKGIPRSDVGLLTDVLDACPKAEGMLMLLRSMSPHVIITDEIGGERDVAAISHIVNAGVKIICSIHGFNIEDIQRRKSLAPLLDSGVFERIIVLSRRNGPGTVEDITICGVE